MTELKDRRQAPRVKVQHHTLSVATTKRVRVLDLSLGGALIATDLAVSVRAAKLTVTLPGGRLSSRIEIRHQFFDDAGTVQVGAAFVEMGNESRRSLEQFLAKPTR